MKKVGKILVVFFLSQFLLVVGFVGKLGFDLFSPTLERADISFFDLLNKHLPEDKYNKLESVIMDQSKTISNKMAAELKSLIYVPKDVYSNMPYIEYPYASIDEVLELHNKSADSGIKQGLKYLEEIENNK